MKDLKKVPIAYLDPLEHALYGMKALKKAGWYLRFFNKLDNGMEVSTHLLRDIERMQRALDHRLAVLKQVA